MGLEYEPDFSLSANDQDITAAIKQYFVRLRYTDNSGKEADKLALTLALPVSVPTPPKGAALRLGLGFGGNLIKKGVFIVDGVDTAGPPRVVQITAQAAPMDNTKAASTLQTQKTRSWDNITLEDMLKTVAADHDLVPKISDALASIQIEHIDQIAESDLNLMMRLSRRYGAVSKPANGYWLFLTEGAGLSVTGKALKELTIKPVESSTWRTSSGSRGKSRMVTATYTDHATGKTETVSAGYGLPEKKIVFPYATREEALQAAASTYKSDQTNSDTLNLTTPATQELLELVAESHVTLEGFGDVEDVRWKVKTLDVDLDTSGMKINIDGIAAV